MPNKIKLNKREQESHGRFNPINVWTLEYTPDWANDNDPEELIDIWYHNQSNGDSIMRTDFLEDMVLDSLPELLQRFYELGQDTPTVPLVIT
jgi:hypothetical protein